MRFIAHKLQAQSKVGLFYYRFSFYFPVKIKRQSNLKTLIDITRDIVYNYIYRIYVIEFIGVNSVNLSKIRDF